jgi:2-keto-3-deoxy-6-phosphogluconate aldolase
MERLQRVYRLVHEQGFLPIFTADEFNSQVLLDACLEAGCRVIEYTLRRRDAHKMIPWIREHYPELCLLVGSTLDDARFVNHARLRHPQLLTIDELATLGVDGFVSMVGFCPETLKRYSSTHFTIAPVSTMLEMFAALSAGAHFVKVAGSRLDFVSELRSDAMYEVCPIMVTGGMSLDRIPLAVRNGTVLAGAGFDLMLGGCGPDVSVSHVAKTVTKYLTAMQTARFEKWPALADAGDRKFEEWVAALPHYHPFIAHARCS